jgi:hypothetical protein
MPGFSLRPARGFLIRIKDGGHDPCYRGATAVWEDGGFRASPSPENDVQLAVTPPVLPNRGRARRALRRQP